MKFDVVVLDPEFESMLRDAAARSGSSLLAKARPERIVTYEGLDSGAVLTPPTGGEIAGELVAVFRSEAARWLLRLAIDAAYRAPDAKYFNPGQEPRIAPAADALSTAASQLVETWEGLGCDDARVEAALDHLSARAQSGEQAGPRELTALSTRFETSVRASLLHAGLLATRGELGSARRAIEDVAPACHQTSERIVVWETLALIEQRSGDLLRAAAANQTVAHLEGSRPLPHLNGITLALQLGDEAGVLRSAERLDALDVVADEVINGFILGIRAQRDIGVWAPTASASRTAARLVSSLGQRSRRVVEVFALALPGSSAAHVQIGLPPEGVSSRR